MFVLKVWANHPHGGGLPLIDRTGLVMIKDDEFAPDAVAGDLYMVGVVTDICTAYSLSDPTPKDLLIHLVQ